MSLKDPEKRREYHRKWLQQKKAEYMAGWRSTHRENIKRNYLKRAFGITVEEAVSMWEKQGCACAVCSTPLRTPAEYGTIDERGAMAHVDHNHATGEIRGILCDKCNRGIGYLKDSVANLQAATAYLLGM